MLQQCSCYKRALLYSTVCESSVLQCLSFYKKVVLCSTICMTVGVMKSIAASPALRGLLL